VNTRSLSVRLVAWYAGVLTLVFVPLGLLTFVSLRHYLGENLLDTQARRARQIADTLVAHARADTEADLAAQVENLYSPEANDRFIRITRAGGAVVYVSGPPREAHFNPHEVPPDPGTLTRTLELPGGSLLVATADAVAGDGVRYRVEVGTSGAPSEALLRRVLAILAVGLPLAVAAAVAGGFLLVRRALRPVAEIARKAQEISEHSLAERLPVVRSGDEIERLSVSLNHMIGRLERSVTGSRQFVADASHELRTPLTVMRGELEGLAQAPGLGSDTRDAVGSVLEEVDRLAEIVEGLLALSRLDAGEVPSERARFDLAELASDTVDQMSLMALDKSLTLTSTSAGKVVVEGDRARLKQVVVNLLDNAIKYTPPRGRIELSVGSQHGEALLEVRDSGIGIPAEALPHVFQRFYRVDGSRSREPGGAGLGLSIVQSICSAHGAALEVQSEPGAGTTFRVRLPLAPEALSRSGP
jgi:heavy metal sensor kinase